MRTSFLSYGKGLDASMLNEAISVGRKAGMWKPVEFSVVGNDLVLSPHSCCFENGVAVVSDGEVYKVDSYIAIQGNSYRGTLVYIVDPELNFEVQFAVLSGIEMPGDNKLHCVLGWILADGNELGTANFFPAPVSSDLVWLFSDLSVGELPNLVRTVNGVTETYVNETADTQVITLERYIAVAKSKVSAIRFHGSLNEGVGLDCYVKSERRDWSVVGSVQGPQVRGKYRIGVFAFNQGDFEMTSVRFVIRVPSLKSFSVDLLGATNEVAYGISSTI